MSPFAAQCQEARDQLEQITLTICGNCVKSCCHHGTMLGSADVPRLHKGLLLSRHFGERLREGLRLRAGELRSDLQELQAVAEPSAQEAGAGHEQRSRLSAALVAWHEYADFLERCDVTDPDALRRLRLFSAVRATAFRALREIPGAIDALGRSAPRRPSLEFRGERIPAERCVLHYEGCLAERWKPAKCANFFCPADPGLVEAVHLSMGFGDFLRANIESIGQVELLEMIRLEIRLGPEYLAPKILFGPGRIADHVGRTLRDAGLAPVIHPRVPSLMMSSHEVLQLLERSPDNMPQITLCGAVQAAGLYEIALGIDRAARNGVVRPWYVVAQDLQRHAVLPHPLWQDRAMAQPVGALEAYVVDTTR